MPPAALFEPAGTGTGFRASPLTRGPWDERMMHGGAPSALVAHAIEQTEPGAGLAVTRLTVEFLGGVPVGAVEVATSLAKPGRRFQVVDATLDADGRRACLARAIRVRRADMPDAAALPPPLRAAPALPGPDSGEPWLPFVEGDDLFYPGATEIASSPARPAPATRSPGSACAASCCPASRRRRSCAPVPPRTSPTG